MFACADQPSPTWWPASGMQPSPVCTATRPCTSTTAVCR
jgi:hypothetical protein